MTEYSQRFLAFHAANPHVYAAFERFARQAIAAGRKKLGAGLIYERMRWYYSIETTGTDEYKLNNTYRAAYRSLANRLRARTASLGSTLYLLTWKSRSTPSGRSIYALRASEAPTSDSAFISQGWPTPHANSSTGPGAEGRDGGLKIQTAVQTAGWPTPTATNNGKGEDPEAKGLRGLNPGLNPADAALLAGWSTASARDWKDTAGMATTGINPDGSVRHRTDQLPRQVLLAGWPTPAAQEPGGTPEAHLQRKKNCVARGAKMGSSAVTHLSLAVQYTSHASLNGPARLTVSGEMLTGSSAGMESGGQLSPAHSRWLQAIPSSWDQAAPLKASRARKCSKATATPSISKSPPDSSGT